MCNTKLPLIPIELYRHKSMPILALNCDHYFFLVGWCCDFWIGTVRHAWGRMTRSGKTTTERGMLGVESQDHKVEKDHDRTRESS